MKLSLFQKLSISLLVTFVLVVAAFILISQRIESISKDSAEQKLHQKLAEHLVHDNPLLASGKFDKKALENLFHSMMILGQSFEFYVLDQHGTILSFSADPGVVKRQSVDLAPVKQFLDEPNNLPFYAQDPRGKGEKIFSAAAIFQGEQLKGYLFIIVRSQIYDNIFSGIKTNSQMEVYGLAALASLIFLFAVLLVSLRFLVAPLKKLTTEVSELKSSDGQQPLLPISFQNRGKEVDSLTNAFNQLINQVNSQFSKLEQVDAERREMLTHLSHDLRTPLASLQGFLETIFLQQNNLSEQEKQAYLSRCLKNARQLKHFVDQILELAHLESSQVSTNLEPLPIAELLFDLKDKFSIKGKQKGIEIAVDVCDETIQIVTDIAKLERILSNLIENAIRHTPEQGIITLKVNREDNANQILLEVKDTGSGIPEEELPYLFDPRFRGNKAMEDGERHIGLGLTITQKLLSILGSQIKVVNNRELGAKFSFSLPIE